MRDLELLDLDLLLSLRPESVILLNELEKSLIRKRELVLFLDRVRGKLRNQEQLPAAQEFRQVVAMHGYNTLTEVDEELQVVVNRLSPKDKQQFVESRNYHIVTKLLREDMQELKEQLGAHRKPDPPRQLRIRLYELCSELATHFI